MINNGDLMATQEKTHINCPTTIMRQVKNQKTKIESKSITITKIPEILSQITKYLRLQTCNRISSYTHRSADTA